MRRPRRRDLDRSGNLRRLRARQTARRASAATLARPQRQSSVEHFAGDFGTGGVGTRSSNSLTGGPDRNFVGSVPRTNGIHTLSALGPAGSPPHGSTRANVTLGGGWKSRGFVRGWALFMKSTQIGTETPPPVILSPIDLESSRQIGRAHV